MGQVASTKRPQVVAPTPGTVRDTTERVGAPSRARWDGCLVLPSLLVVLGVALCPLVRTFLLSLTDARLGRPRAVGLSAWQTTSICSPTSAFRNAVWNTTVFTVFSVFFENTAGAGYRAGDPL